MLSADNVFFFHSLQIHMNSSRLNPKLSSFIHKWHILIWGYEPIQHRQHWLNTAESKNHSSAFSFNSQFYSPTLSHTNPFPTVHACDLSHLLQFQAEINALKLLKMHCCSTLVARIIIVNHKECADFSGFLHLFIVCQELHLMLKHIQQQTMNNNHLTMWIITTIIVNKVISYLKCWKHWNKPACIGYGVPGTICAW